MTCSKRNYQNRSQLSNLACSFFTYNFNYILTPVIFGLVLHVYIYNKGSLSKSIHEHLMMHNWIIQLEKRVAWFIFEGLIAFATVGCGQDLMVHTNYLNLLYITSYQVSTSCIVDFCWKKQSKSIIDNIYYNCSQWSRGIFWPGPITFLQVQNSCKTPHPNHSVQFVLLLANTRVLCANSVQLFITNHFTKYLD